MVGSTHKCGQPRCLFPVDEGMQCDECKSWFHKMCTRLSPTAYKRCSKPNSHWLCMFCCANKTLLIQEAMSLLALACKKNDRACTDNMSTDSDECVSVVVPAVTRRLKHPNLIDGKVKSPLILPREEAPPETNISNQVPLVDTEDLNKTVTVPNSPGVLKDEKWTTVRNKRSEKKKAVGNAQVVSKSLVNSHCESQNVLPKSDRKRENHPGVTEKKNLISSNIIVSKLLESNDPDPKIRHAHDLEKLGDYIRSILPDNSKGVQVKKLVRIGKRTENNAEPRPCRLLKVILGSETQRDLLLSNARCHDNSDIRVRPDMSLEDRIKRKKALAELEIRQQNGEKNLRLVGFRIVKSWKRMLPRPVWIGRST
ncbi:unnamed protein product [Schistosoma spindalis]|nr:unnamed protein product [Schistosoma spindale]